MKQGINSYMIQITNSLTSFKETRDIYNNVQKLENKMNLIEQKIQSDSTVDFIR